MERIFDNKILKNMFQVGDYNVVRVGWVGGSLTVKYPQASVDTQIAGAEIGLFIKNVMVGKKAFWSFKKLKKLLSS